MQTVVDINNTFISIVEDHEQLKSFHTFSLDLLDMDKLGVDDYPLLYAQCTGATVDGGDTVFSYEVIVGDLVIEKQQQILTQVYAETLLIMQDVAAKFYFNVVTSNTTVDGTWAFDLPITCDPFTARFDTLLTGWSTTFEIKLPNAINLCIAPFTP